MLRLTEVVKHLLIINILVFFAMQIYPALYDYLPMASPWSDAFMPMQIVTHMFAHANFTHLFLNMFGLYMFGPILENQMGPKRFLAYYLITGLGAAVIYVLSFILQFYFRFGDQWTMALPHIPTVLGASGAIFGLLVAFGMIFPNMRVMLLFPPIPMKAKYMVLLFALIEIVSGVGNLQPGVANFAHLGGAITGAILILFWRRSV
ncbi:MAG: rhomboid family intramembrane serine protease [Saprospiraceae bacterium]